MPSDHDRLGALEQRLLNIERFTGLDGVNGLQKQLLDMKIDMDTKFDKVYSKLDEMETRRAAAVKWRVGTAIASVASMTALLTLLFMIMGRI